MGTEATAQRSSPVRRLLVRRHVEEMVRDGGLTRGAKLPSILELSHTLGVAKNTVIAALDDLCSDGTLEAREREGFFVSRAQRRERAKKTRLSDLEIDRVAHGMATTLTQSGDELLGIGGGTAAESLLATPAWTAFLKAAPPRDPHSSLRYADPSGEPRLREAVVARFGSADEPTDRVLVTQGAVDALNHVFAVVAAASGVRRVAIESPGYFMLAPMLLEQGLEPVPIPRDRGGLDLGRLRREAQRGLAAVLVNPNHHNPTGATMSLSQRFELASLADEHALTIVEDDVYRGLYVDEEEPPTLRSLLPRRTVFVSSFSKTLGPGLRVGFVLGPESLLLAVRRRKFLQSLTGDAYTQNLVAEFVDRRGYQRHLNEVRAELSRRARIARVQAEPLQRLGKLDGPFRGGLFWQLQLAAGIDAMALYRAARARGVLLSPGCFFHSEVPVVPSRVRWLRLNVSRCEGDTLARTLRMLQSIVDAGGAAGGP